MPPVGTEAIGRSTLVQVESSKLLSPNDAGQSPFGVARTRTASPRAMSGITPSLLLQPNAAVASPIAASLATAVARTLHLADLSLARYRGESADPSVFAGPHPALAGSSMWKVSKGLRDGSGLDGSVVPDLRQHGAAS